VTNATLASGIERLRVVMDALERADGDAFRAAIADVMAADCEWEPLITEVEGGQDYRGRDGMADFFDDFVGAFEVRYIDPQFRAIGEHVVLVLVTMELRGRESGIEVPREMGAVFEFEDGLVRRARAFDSHREAEAEAMRA
jgi:SnoaL-like domain